MSATAEGIASKTAAISASTNIHVSRLGREGSATCLTRPSGHANVAANTDMRTLHGAFFAGLLREFAEADHDDDAHHA